MDNRIREHRKCWRKLFANALWDDAELVEMLQHPPHTMVVMQVYRFNRWFIASGHARLGSGDVWDSDLGVQIAKGRAIKELARQLEQHDWQLQEHVEIPYQIVWQGPSAAELT